MLARTLSCSLNSSSTITSTGKLCNIPKISLRPVINFCLNSRYKRKFSRYSDSTIMYQSEIFKIDDYDIIGFDLDNTLLRYNVKEMIPLETKAIANFMVKCRDYPKELMKPIAEDMKFMQKGLMFDVDGGNILKIDPNGFILCAAHGSQFLSDEKIIQIYGPERQWTYTTQFSKDPVSTWNGPPSEKLRTLLDYFDMPASLIFARAVDIIDAESKKRPSKYSVYSDILSALISMYRRESFADDSSEYFEALKADPAQYIVKASPKVVSWLKHLKEAKATFLLTGSNIDFANLTATESLGPNWRDLFDAVVCYARKPGFFIENRPFFHVEGIKETVPVPNGEPLRLNTVYSQGNWTQLKSLLMKKLKLGSPRCLYIGDNLIQDIYTPSQYSNFDTIAVIEEMLLDKPDNDNKDKESIINSKVWDSYFRVGNNPTIWTDIIEKHSKLCIPTIDYLAKNPLQYEYICTNSRGFYPFDPID